MKVGRKMSDELTNLAVVDTKTGEVRQYLTKSEDKILRKRYTSTSIDPNRLNDDNAKKSSDLFYMYISETCGSFYHNYYNNVIPHKFIFRFLYLCTFMNYKGYLEYGNAKEESKLVTKSNLQEILNLSNKQFYETYNYLLDNKMILDDQYIKINNKFCNKGNIINKKDEVVRMFNDAIRYLYDNSSANEHNKIGMLIKLLPYVHFNTNIICSNPTEEKDELIKPLKQKEILHILDVTKPTIASLLQIKILNNSEYAFIKLSNGSFKNVYVINPRFVFKGNNMNKIEETLKWFKLGL